MSWIKTIKYEDAESSLKRIYKRVKGPDNNVDNVLTIHSLRPHTLTGHMTLYKSVLHNSNNSFPKWQLELIGIYVSYLNNCHYCVDHHFAGLKRLLNNDEQADTYRKAIEQNTLGEILDSRLCAALEYAHKITTDIQKVREDDLLAMRKEGLSDGEILEINQVASYFNYVNRTVLGLGVTTKGDELGLSPGNSEDPKNWNHH